MHPIRSSSLVPALLAVSAALAGCGSDNAPGAAGPATPPGAGSATPLTVAAAKKRACTPDPNFRCSDDSLWASQESINFGKDDFPIDADGCMRMACQRDEDCEAGELCHKPACYSPNVECLDRTRDDGQVACMCSGDPSCGGGYCKKGS